MDKNGTIDKKKKKLIHFGREKRKLKPQQAEEKEGKCIKN